MGERAAGILLHPPSLPGRFGAGDLGPEVDRFLDWMREAGLRVWQVLPLHPPVRGDSPYGAASVFAGDPALISLEALVELGWLGPTDLAGFPARDPGRIDHAGHRAFLEPRLRAARQAFAAGRGTDLREEADRWAREDAAAWLDDWTLYRALRSEAGGAPWTEWDGALRGRRPEALEAARRRLADEIAFERFLQFVVDRQLRRVRTAAEARGIRILGDLPIYVDLESAEVWARPDLFALDGDGRPEAVAGCPPDYFAEDGQLWGNPLYRWDRMAERGFRWWSERLRGDLRWAHEVRLDHFRGFVGYWRIPADAATAREGEWALGPGRALFDAVRAELGHLPILAEDLGEITPEVDALREELGLPGMVVLQFGFERPDSPHAPHHHGRRRVVYTGTHDNDTVVGWYGGLGEGERRTVDAYLGRGEGGSDPPIWRELVRTAFASPAERAIVPAQDVLGLGPEARTNVPGRPKGNWTWRLLPGALDGAAARWLRELAQLTDRLAPG